MHLLTYVNGVLLLSVLFTNLFLYCYPLLYGASYLIPFRRPAIRMLILAGTQAQRTISRAKLLQILI